MSGLTRSFIFLALVLSFLVAWAMPFVNEDLFLAFCAGRDTLGGMLARGDTWSFTTDGRVWVDQSWFSHLLYYLSYLGLGDWGPVLAKALLLIATLVLLYVRCRGLGASPVVCMLALALGTLGLAPFLKIRAENFGMFCFVLTATFITAGASWGRWRPIGCLGALALWSNAHGSFMLGFCIIGLRTLVEVLRWARVLPCPSSPPKGIDHSLERSHSTTTDPWGWLVALALAVVVIAFVNPYGVENLTIPFRQLTAAEVTEQWVDWRPLFDPASIFERGVFKAFSVVPFLVLLVLTVGLLCALTAVAGKRNFRSAFSTTGTRTDLLVEALMPIMLAPLVFRFQRMILFAAAALVPILAFLIQRLAETVRGRFQKVESIGNSREGLRISAYLAFAWVLICTFIFYKAIFLRYLPGNPLDPQREDRPLAGKLMTSTLSRPDLISFMKMNHVRGRAFTTLFLSDYLLYHVPDLKLFFDLRAQSIFPESVIKDYVSVMRPTPEVFFPEYTQSTLDLLNRFDVSLVILNTSTGPHGYFLASKLMESRAFVCVYFDTWSIVLASVRSERFAPIIASGNLDTLRYPSPETKIVSQVYLSYFMHGQISPELMASLMESLRRRPDPHVYLLVSYAQKGGNKCLDDQTRAFLESEAQRLASLDYLVTGGARTIMASLLRIVEFLDVDDSQCRRDKRSRKYAALRLKYVQEFERIKAHHGGF